ncbi:hypothetical protein ABE504_32875 [Paenibacillus oryzisoli]|uniref:hypothetical protein n=1 Tax=Paenibacillus oryzisoli TaxID=1850517 RepID=UPI003D29FF56
MSWDKDFERKNPCPCGGSTYTVESYSDDWGRNEEKWFMSCHICNQTHVLFTNDYYDSGLSVSSNFWVTQQSLQNYKTLVEDFSKIQKDTINFLKECYLDQWLQSFTHLRSKKAIWERLSSTLGLGISLPTFYKHCTNVQEYLQDLFRLQFVKKIVDILEVSNEEITLKFKEIETKEAEVRAVKAILIKNGFR